MGKGGKIRGNFDFPFLYFIVDCFIFDTLMFTIMTNEQQIRNNIKKSSEAKKLKSNTRAVDFVYAKYIASPPGTTYVAIINENRAFLPSNCNTCG